MTAEPEPSATEPPIPGSPVRPVFTLPKTVALVGLMGVGKTTIGRRLADHFGLPFVDADEEIEKAAGMTIADIFANYGEKGFRDGEQRVIARLLEGEPRILATGGGAILDPDNRQWLAARGYVVYLHASIEQQLARTERTDTRPLLQGGNRRDTLERLFLTRDPLYREIADLVLPTDGRNARALAREIEEHLGRTASAP